MEGAGTKCEEEVFWLAKLRRLKDVLPPDIKKKVYNALVLPHLDYCSVVWQESTKDLRMKVERVQNYGM